MTDPFDRNLPSPIAPLLALRASARDAVVGTEATELQDRMFVPTGLEDRILELAASDPAPALIVLSGSAGGGKSASIAWLRKAAPSAFGAVLEDATHADTPGEDQIEALVRFFEPLSDDAPPYGHPPMLAAMNTGMAVVFFDRLAARGEARFGRLRSEILGQLEIGEPRAAEAVGIRPVVVVNLDVRRTTGGPDSLFGAMLGRLDPDLESGIQAGSARCATCEVRPSCFVRANAEMASAEPVRGVLDSMADEIALDRGRPLQPRWLWDLASDLVTAGQTFPDDPCDLIAEIARRGDRQAVWDGLIWNGAFTAPRGPASGDLAAIDPSFDPSGEAHAVITRAGISGERDAAGLVGRFGAGRSAACVGTAASALRDGAPDRSESDRAIIARGLVRASVLAGEIPFARDEGTFERALEEYGAPAGGPDENLEALVRLLAEALARAFGEVDGADTYFRAERLESQRHGEVLVRAEFSGANSLVDLVPDPAPAASPAGSAVAGHRPLSIVLSVAGVRLAVDRPLYGLLESTASGTMPSTADLERFYALRRAAEALGRRAAQSSDVPLIIRDRQTGRRYRLSRDRDLRHREQVSLRALGRG